MFSIVMPAYNEGAHIYENLLKTNEIYRDVYESQIKGSGDFDKGGED